MNNKIPEIKQLLENELQNAIDNYFQNTTLYEGTKYIMETEGKRIRPLILLLTAYSISKSLNLPYKTAAAVEIFHNFTLVHDDFMDNAEVRRNKKTLHLKYNKNYAILVGDALLTIVFDLIANDRKNKSKIQSISIFTKKSLNVCEGQSKELSLIGKNISEEDYLQIIQYKTAELISASLILGYISTTENPETKIINLLDNLGKNIGIFFQLQDDIMDFYPPTKAFGKQIGGDIIENKKTILWFSAYKKASQEDKKLLEQIFQIKEPKEKITLAQNLFNKYDAKKSSEQFAEKYLKNVEQTFAKLQEHFDTKLLQSIFKNIKQRKK